MLAFSTVSGLMSFMQVTYTFKVHRDICLFVCFCLIVQDLSWETVVSASVLVHCLALIKFYVFYISQSFVISSLSFGILSLIMFCSCHYMPCLYIYAPYVGRKFVIKILYLVQ